MSSPSPVLLRFLTVKQVQRLYRSHIAKNHPTQQALLESAVSSPQNHKYYGETDLFKLAGILAEKIILSHAYQDGNKRAAMATADMFLKINGYRLQQTPFEKDSINEGLANAHLAIATQQWTSVELAEYYRSIARPLAGTTSAIEEFLSQSEEM